MSEETIRLESKLAYLEDYVQKMNQVIIDQGFQMKQQGLEIEKLKKKLTDIFDSQPQDLENRRPPHY